MARTRGGPSIDREELVRQMNQLKSDVVSMVSHELRTPLATIKEFTAILTDGLAGPTSANQREYLKIIHGNIDRMVRIIDNLLDISKLEADRAVLNRQVVRVHALMDHVVESMGPLAKAKQITLTLNLPQEPMGLFADSDKITQVLSNLMSNAIKFTKAGGRLTITVEKLVNEVQFCVEDTGIGIAEHDLPKMFEKFQQLHQLTGTSQVHGTGLGLAITKRLVELHGGRVWVESVQEQGSRFYFTLPFYHLDEVFKEQLRAGIAQAKQRQSCFSIVVMAVNDYSALKARYGTEELVQVLKRLEQGIQDAVRRGAGDVVVRWDVGEMIVILAEVGQAGCRAIADRIKQLSEAHPYHVTQGNVKLKVSIGTATYPDEALEAEELLQAAEQRIKPSSRSRPRVLVVDDEVKLRNFLKKVLELRDLEVITVATGPEAIDQLTRQSVDLILLDLMMPVMNGYEVYHLLKENPDTKDIPVLIVTGKGERTDRQLGLGGIQYNYIRKPFSTEELISKVQELLKHRVPHAQRVAKRKEKYR